MSSIKDLPIKIPKHKMGNNNTKPCVKKLAQREKLQNKRKNIMGSKISNHHHQK
jgi:hypothetical protein